MNILIGNMKILDFLNDNFEEFNFENNNITLFIRDTDKNDLLEKKEKILNSLEKEDYTEEINLEHDFYEVTDENEVSFIFKSTFNIDNFLYEEIETILNYFK